MQPPALGDPAARVTWVTASCGVGLGFAGGVGVAVGVGLDEITGGGVPGTGAAGGLGGGWAELEFPPALTCPDGGAVLAPPPAPARGSGVGDSVPGAAVAAGGDGLLPGLSRSNPAATAGFGSLAECT